MNQDAVCGFARIFHACQTARLNPVFGISQRVLIRHLSQTQRLHTHPNARRIHHHKHGSQALVGLPHHRAYRAIEHHLASGITVDAHLVL